MTPLPMGEEPTVIIKTDRGPVDVDESIAPIVWALNAVGAETIASCSGHGHRPGNIALRDGREIIIARDFEEARRIDALFPVGANGEVCGLEGSAVVERVAQAIYGRNPYYDQNVDADDRPVSAPFRLSWDDLSEKAREDFIEDARAAIKAMREPTEAQIRAVDKALHEHWPNARKMAVAMQHAMIDSALSKAKGEA